MSPVNGDWALFFYPRKIIPENKERIVKDVWEGWRAEKSERAMVANLSRTIIKCATRLWNDHPDLSLRGMEKTKGRNNVR